MANSSYAVHLSNFCSISRNLVVIADIFIWTSFKYSNFAYITILWCNWRHLGVAVGNYGSFTIEVQVSCGGDNSYYTLINASTFMSAAESRNTTNRHAVRMFKTGLLKVFLRHRELMLHYTIAIEILSIWFLSCRRFWFCIQPAFLG